MLVNLNLAGDFYVYQDGFPDNRQHQLNKFGAEEEVVSTDLFWVFFMPFLYNGIKQ